ncbi:acyl carrier protein [Streptomyces sp. NPDC058398]|uniref:acyl carrier protein n=1 Tax=Streptomyces sp. NPDC058398 TaxID=3346479 RepID=UPI003658F68E
MQQEIRAVLADLPKVGDVAGTLPEDADLWSAGMDSLTSVQLMLRLEDHFGVEFPDEALTRDTFGSIRSLCGVLGGLLVERKAGAS